MTAGCVTADPIDRSLNDPRAVPPSHGLNRALCLVRHARRTRLGYLDGVVS
jgi:hypothetical protein